MKLASSDVASRLPIPISVRDFASGGTGATANTGQNFRLGLLTRSTTSQNTIDFYQGGDDGIALSITNGTSYALRYKSDRANNGDPHLGARALYKGFPLEAWQRGSVSQVLTSP